jgi:hypothetical protein
VVHVNGDLNAVTATSAANAWAVGERFNAHGTSTLTVHWNGAAWKQVPSPTPSNCCVTLRGVAVVSARDAWAVGFTIPPRTPAPGTLHGYVSVILHWNGAAWKRVPSPNPGGFANLWGVAATSASNAWAVGWDGKPLILRWNGTAWKQVPSPAAASDGILRGVAALSARSAWAVGYPISSKRALILRWNGSRWNQVTAPLAGYFGVAAPSATRAWAVGGGSIIAWNGTRWK